MSPPPILGDHSTALCPKIGAIWVWVTAANQSPSATQPSHFRLRSSERCSESRQRRAAIMPVNCHRAFIVSSQMTGTHSPSGSASYEHAYDPLSEDRAANLHRQRNRIGLLPLQPGILQPDLLSALPRDARVVRPRCMGLRFQSFRRRRRVCATSCVTLTPVPFPARWNSQPCNTICTCSVFVSIRAIADSRSGCSPRHVELTKASHPGRLQTGLLNTVWPSPSA